LLVAQFGLLSLLLLGSQLELLPGGSGSARLPASPNYSLKRTAAMGCGIIMPSAAAAA
jgi:hypothetical protein